MDGETLASSDKPFTVKIKPFSNNNISIPVELQMGLLKETSVKFNPERIDSALYELSLNYVAETLLLKIRLCFRQQLRFLKTRSTRPW